MVVCNASCCLYSVLCANNAVLPDIENSDHEPEDVEPDGVGQADANPAQGSSGNPSPNHDATTDTQSSTIPKKINRKRATAASCSSENPKRRRWTEFENSLLFQTFGQDISRKAMPSGKRIAELSAKMSHSRGVAQIRTQVHNYISAKIKM